MIHRDYQSQNNDGKNVHLCLDRKKERKDCASVPFSSSRNTHAHKDAVSIDPSIFSIYLSMPGPGPGRMVYDQHRGRDSSLGRGGMSLGGGPLGGSQPEVLCRLVWGAPTVFHRPIPNASMSVSNRGCVLWSRCLDWPKQGLPPSRI